MYLILTRFNNVVALLIFLPNNAASVLLRNDSANITVAEIAASNIVPKYGYVISTSIA